MTRTRYRGWMLGFVGGAVLASAVPLINFARAIESPSPQSPSSPVEFTPPAGTASFADVVARVSPAVVTITVTKSASVTPAGLPEFDGPRGGPMDDFFGHFFGMPGLPLAPQEVKGMGSGFIIDANGYVVTNNHVIDDATQITVALEDGTQLDAELVGRDPKTDLALLKIDDGDNLPHVAFGDSDAIRVGDWVLAIGNPFGLGGTATAGIISARGRDIHSGPYDDYLQIDAPINSGNSGGPVFNANGEVIGVNTAIYSPSGGNVGIGFAIPANQVDEVISELETAGSVSRGWLGVQIQPLDDDLAADLGLGSTDGALITEVVAGSPAAKAGLETGDVITEVDTHAIDSPKTLTRLIGDTDPDQRVRLTVWRNGDERTVRAKLGSAETTRTASDVREPKASGAKLGLGLTELDDEYRSRLGVSDDVTGVLVARVERNSPAARKGVRSGDILLAVNGAPVTTVDEAAAAITDARSDSDHAMLLLRRGDNQRFVSLPLA